MDIKKLRISHQKLLDYMEQEHFGKVALCGVRAKLKQLFEKEGQYESYDDFYRKFINPEGLSGTSPKLKHQRTSLRHVQAFDEFDHYPDRLTFTPTLYHDSCESRINETYKSIIENYLELVKKTSKAPQSIRVESKAAAAFFDHVQRLGASSPSEITEHLILSFFYDGFTQKRCSSYKSKVLAVLRSTRGTKHEAECFRIIDLMPPLKKYRKNFAILNDSEVRIIKDALQEDSTLTLREKAVVSVAMFTGLRATDIAKMTVDEIDWNNDIIMLKQSKTHQDLILPLRAVVGNALYEYLLKERPNISEIKNIFLNMHCPSRPLTGEAIGGLARSFFEKLGIRCGEGQNGIRLFRRYLATKLLQEGVTPRYISEIMGHLSPESLNPYINADIEHLRECGLDISMYPIGEEVFDV